MTDELTAPLDLTDPDLAELAAIAPRDPARVVPSWPAAEDRSLADALHPGHATLRRVGTLAAAAAVLAAVGAGLALAAPAPLTPATRAAACEGQPEAVDPSAVVPAGVTATVRRAAGSAAVSVAGLPVGASSLVVQLVAADGRPLTAGRQAVGHQVDITSGDLCGGRRWDEVAASGTRVRVVYATAHDGRRCLVLTPGHGRVVSC